MYPDYTHFNKYILKQFLNAYLVSHKHTPKQLSKEQKLQAFSNAHEKLKVYPRASYSFLNRLIIAMLDIGFKDPIGCLKDALKAYCQLSYVDLFSVKTSKDFLQQAEKDFWLSL